MSKIIMRDFIPKDDSGFIYSTWPKSVYYSGVHVSDIEKREWFKNFHEYMQRTLPICKIYVASDREDPFFILGYSIINEDNLLFVYVKDAYRKQKLASALLKDKGITQYAGSFVTRIGAAILAEHPNLFKENDYERPKTGQSTDQKKE